MRDYEQAAEEWLKDLSLNPGHKKTQLYLEKAYEKSKTLKDYYFAGVDALSKNDCDNAIQSLSAVVLLDPKYREAVSMLRRAYMMCKLSVVVRTSSNGGGLPFTNRTVSIDDAYTLYAAVYKDGKFFADMPFYWDIFGKKNNDLSPSFNLAFFDVGNLGTLSLFPSDQDDEAVWKSKEIICIPGKAVNFKIFNAQTQKVPDSIVIKADESLRLVSKGFDASGNDLGAIPVVWTVYSNSEPDDSKVMSTGLSPWYELALPSARRKYSVKAERKGLDAVIVNNISIEPGAPAYVIIEDDAVNGTEVFNRKFYKGEKISLFAIAYDMFDNRIGSLNVRWVGTSGLESLVAGGPAASIDLKGDVGKNGMIKAFPDENVIGDETGVISFASFDVGKIKILDLHGIPVTDLLLDQKDKIMLTAGLFDLKGSFVKYIKADWRILSGKEVKALSEKKEIFSYTPGMSDGISSIEAIFVLEDAVFRDEIKISFKDREIDHIGLIGLDDNVVFKEIRLTMDETMPCKVMGYDLHANPVGILRDVHFDSSGLVEVQDREENFTILPKGVGSEKVTASYTDKSGKIFQSEFYVEILPGRPHTVQIFFDGKTGKDLFVTNNHPLVGLKLAGYDKQEIFTGWLPATWTCDGHLIDPYLSYMRKNDMHIEAHWNDFETYVNLCVLEKESLELIFSKDLIQYEIRTNDILYSIVMDVLGFSAGYNQIMPELKAIGHLNGVKDINLIYPKKTVLFPYMHISKTVSYEKLSRILSEKFGTKRFFVFGKPRCFSGEITGNDKIIIFDPKFLAKEKPFQGEIRIEE